MEKTISPTGLNLIKSFESFAATPYVCPAGKLTVGYGHVIRAGENFKRGVNIEMATNLLHLDVGVAERPINSHGLSLEQHEFDALCSFVFNVGSGNFNNSTLLKKLQAGDKAGAAEEFTRWNKAGGKVLSGLVKRREAERKLFLTGEWQ